MKCGLCNQEMKKETMQPNSRHKDIWYAYACYNPLCFCGKVNKK